MKLKLLLTITLVTIFIGTFAHAECPGGAVDSKDCGYRADSTLKVVDDLPESYGIGNKMVEIQRLGAYDEFAPTATREEWQSYESRAIITNCQPSKFEQKCYNKDMYWYDRCGNRGSMAEDCIADCADGDTSCPIVALRGDANLDGTVNVGDSLLINQHIVGTTTLIGQGFNNAAESSIPNNIINCSDKDAVRYCILRGGASPTCFSGFTQTTCSDGTQNGCETGGDCGGSECVACGSITTGGPCTHNNQCVSGTCVGGICTGTPVNAVCGSSGPHTCSTGLMNWSSAYQTGTNDYGWTCSGENGGSDASCTYPYTAPVCGWKECTQGYGKYVNSTTFTCEVASRTNAYNKDTVTCNFSSECGPLNQKPLSGSGTHTISTGSVYDGKYTPSCRVFENGTTASSGVSAVNLNTSTGQATWTCTLSSLFFNGGTGSGIPYTTTPVNCSATMTASVACDNDGVCEPGSGEAVGSCGDCCTTTSEYKGCGNVSGWCSSCSDTQACYWERDMHCNTAPMCGWHSDCACGDGNWDSGSESCDDANANETDACNSSCQWISKNKGSGVIAGWKYQVLSGNVSSPSSYTNFYVNLDNSCTSASTNGTWYWWKDNVCSSKYAVQSGQMSSALGAQCSSGYTSDSTRHYQSGTNETIFTIRYICN